MQGQVGASSHRAPLLALSKSRFPQPGRAPSCPVRSIPVSRPLPGRSVRGGRACWLTHSAQRPPRQVSLSFTLEVQLEAQRGQLLQIKRRPRQKPGQWVLRTVEERLIQHTRTRRLRRRRRRTNVGRPRRRRRRRCGKSQVAKLSCFAKALNALWLNLLARSLSVSSKKARNTIHHPALGLHQKA